MVGRCIQFLNCQQFADICLRWDKTFVPRSERRAFGTPQKGTTSFTKRGSAFLSGTRKTSGHYDSSPGTLLLDDCHFLLVECPLRPLQLFGRLVQLVLGLMGVC